MEYFVSYIVEYGSPENFHIANCFIDFNGKLKIENNLHKLENLVLESENQVTPIDFDGVTNVSIMNCYKLKNARKQKPQQTITNFNFSEQENFEYVVDYIITDMNGYKTYEEGYVTYPYELDSQETVIKMLEAMYRQFPKDYILSVLKIEESLGDYDE